MSSFKGKFLRVSRNINECLSDFLSLKWGCEEGKGEQRRVVESILSEFPFFFLLIEDPKGGRMEWNHVETKAIKTMIFLGLSWGQEGRWGGETIWPKKVRWAATGEATQLPSSEQFISPLWIILANTLSSVWELVLSALSDGKICFERKKNANLISKENEETGRFDVFSSSSSSFPSRHWIFSLSALRLKTMMTRERLICCFRTFKIFYVKYFIKEHRRWDFRGEINYKN